jgi:pimeloyl-ACP methyl ester carboxylesterase
MLSSQRNTPRGSFGCYRALDTTIAQDELRKKRMLGMPVLAVGGARSVGENVGSRMKLVAHDVQSEVIPGSGHWVAEEAPEELLAALTAFLACQAQTDGSSARAAASATRSIGCGLVGPLFDFR